MGRIDTTSSDDLGVRVGGSARKGHEINLGRENALRQIFGTSHEKQAEALLSHGLKVLNPNEADDEKPANDERLFMLSVVNEIAPRDPVERMLAVQMAATHVATIRAGKWLASCENLPQCQAHYTGFNKLARMFAAQVEALRKHRTGGQQRVVVEHVTVNEGGQAIVGNVGGRGGNE